MTLFDQCVEAAERYVGTAPLIDAPQSVIRNLQAAHITRAVLETIRDNTPSPRTVDEMCRVLGEAGVLGRPCLAHAPISNTASDRMLERLPVRIGPNCEPVA